MLKDSSVASGLFAFLSACASTALAQEQPARFDCVITPSHTVELGSPVPGLLHEVLVDRSDPVTAGQVVASLDSDVEQANVSIARFKADTDTELRLREAALEIDLRTEERLSSLAALKVASAQDRDRVVREARVSAWRMRQAQDDLDLHALEFARARALLERRRIRSPIDGVVVARLRTAGEYIEDQPLLRIVQLDPLHVEAILPIRLFGKVHPGMQAEVTPEFDDRAAYQATVDVIDPMGDAGSGTFGVRLWLPNPEHTIPAGLKCRVRLIADAPLLSTLPAAPEDQPGLPFPNLHVSQPFLASRIKEVAGPVFAPEGHADTIDTILDAPADASVSGP